MAGQRRKAEEREKTYGGAFQREGYKGVRAAAGAEGDISTAAGMDDAINAMDERQRQDAGLRAQFMGQAAYGLSQIQDPAQRQAALMEMVETSGQAFNITPEQAAKFDLSDQNLKNTYEMSMSVAEKLGFKHEADRDKVGDERWNKTHALQAEGVALEKQKLEAALKAAAAPNSGDEGIVRKEYLSQAAPFISTRDSFARIQSAQATPAGDVSLVYSYMKILDPQTGVKEGEIAIAGQTTNLPGQLVTLYNQVVNGQRLNAQQRQDFKSQAAKLYQTAEAGYEVQLDIYRGIAGEYGFDPERVVPDLRSFDFGDPGDDAGADEQGGGDMDELDAILGGKGAYSVGRR